MAQYKVYVFCNHCSDVHPMPIGINLDNGPVEKTKLRDLYSGEELPKNIARLLNNKVTCPNSGKLFTQKDNDQVFLVPISND